MTSTKSYPGSPATENAYPFYPVVIVGAGASGIAMGCRLKQKLKLDHFKIFDRQSGIGGTWWINRYPGVECDVPTSLYSFSFSPNYTSNRIYPSGKDYVEYLNQVAEKFSITDKIQLNTDVTSLRYIEQDREWEVNLSYLPTGTGDLSTKERLKLGTKPLKTETVRAKIVISCVGVLVEPNDWPESVLGRDNFQGEIIHSSRWRDDVELKGKDIVVIGSGCSAAQIVPSLLAKDVKSVTQIMRTPPWVDPRIDEPFGKELYSKHAPTVFRYMPFLGFAMRSLIYMVTELQFATIFRKNGKFLRRFAEKAALKHMRSKVPKKYQEMMTPQYSYGCKRRVFDSAWLESMNDEKFTLTTQPLQQVLATAVVLGTRQVLDKEPPNEIELPADVIVLANGFEATRFLHPLKVHGRGGLSLHDLWDERGGAQAYMGTSVDGFPNFFMAVGPNTFVGHSSVILGIESTVGYIIRIISPILKGEAMTAEPKMEATLKWTAGVQRDLTSTVFAGCNSWYKGEDDYNSTMYPRSQIDFGFRCRFPRYQDWDITYTEKALEKKRRRRIMAYLAVLITAVGAFFVKW